MRKKVYKKNLDSACESTQIPRWDNELICDQPAATQCCYQFC